MAKVVLRQVSKHFGALTAVDGVDLEVQEGEVVTLLGPSGCGKTTTLRLIAGFTSPSSGRILIGDEEVTHLAPRRRKIGMVFQDYALFPHLTAGENIAFGLRERGVMQAEILARVHELLDLVRLTGVEERFPSQLSGGQQQRVALARALACTPRVLLMDEPLGALDLKLRQVMQTELHRIQRELRITTIYVTHDQEEAMSLSDRIAVMADGRVIQVAAPEELYARPATPFVAEFVGKTNLLTGRVRRVEGRQCTVQIGADIIIVVHTEDTLHEGQDVRLALRPESLRMSLTEQGLEGNRIIAFLEWKRFLGNLSHYFVRTTQGDRLMVEVLGGSDIGRAGDKLWISWKTEDCRVFPQV